MANNKLDYFIACFIFKHDITFYDILAQEAMSEFVFLGRIRCEVLIIAMFCLEIYHLLSVERLFCER